MQLAVEYNYRLKYISISYLTTHRRVSRHKAQANAQATIFHKKTHKRQGASDLLLVKFSKRQGTMTSFEITLYYFIYK